MLTQYELHLIGSLIVFQSALFRLRTDVLDNKAQSKLLLLLPPIKIDVTKITT